VINIKSDWRRSRCLPSLHGGLVGSDSVALSGRPSWWTGLAPLARYSTLASPPPAWARSVARQMALILVCS